MIKKFVVGLIVVATSLVASISVAGTIASFYVDEAWQLIFIFITANLIFWIEIRYLKAEVIYLFTAKKVFAGLIFSFWFILSFFIHTSIPITMTLNTRTHDALYAQKKTEYFCAVPEGCPVTMTYADLYAGLSGSKSIFTLDLLWQSIYIAFIFFMATVGIVSLIIKIKKVKIKTEAQHIVYCLLGLCYIGLIVIWPIIDIFKLREY